MTLQLVFLFVLWLLAGWLFVRAWRTPTPRTGGGDNDTVQPRPHPYEQLGQKAP